MKQIGLILIVFALISCQHKNGSTEKKSETGQTEVKIDEVAHDFGTVSSGEIVVYDFVVTNTGSKNLVIKKAEADCGCITVHLPESDIKPGEQGNIEVEFDSSGLFGKQLKTIDLDWNCKETKQLVIFATVKNDEIEIKY